MISAQEINVFLHYHRIVIQQKPTLATNNYVGGSELSQFPLFLKKETSVLREGVLWENYKLRSFCFFSGIAEFHLMYLIDRELPQMSISRTQLYLLDG